jgi:hypothetical protein
VNSKSPEGVSGSIRLKLFFILDHGHILNIFHMSIAISPVFMIYELLCAVTLAFVSRHFVFE